MYKYCEYKKSRRNYMYVSSDEATDEGDGKTKKK